MLNGTRLNPSHRDSPRYSLKLRKRATRLCGAHGVLVGGEELVPGAFIFVWEIFLRPKPLVLSAECFFGLKYCVLCILCLFLFVRLFVCLCAVCRVSAFFPLPISLLFHPPPFPFSPFLPSGPLSCSSLSSVPLLLNERTASAYWKFPLRIPPWCCAILGR